MEAKETQGREAEQAGRRGKGTERGLPGTQRQQGRRRWGRTGRKKSENTHAPREGGGALCTQEQRATLLCCKQVRGHRKGVTEAVALSQHQALGGLAGWREVTVTGATELIHTHWLTP